MVWAEFPPFGMMETLKLKLPARYSSCDIVPLLVRWLKCENERSENFLFTFFYRRGRFRGRRSSELTSER